MLCLFPCTFSPFQVQILDSERIIVLLKRFPDPVVCTIGTQIVKLLVHQYVVGSFSTTIVLYIW